MGPPEGLDTGTTENPYRRMRTKMLKEENGREEEVANEQRRKLRGWQWRDRTDTRIWEEAEGKIDKAKDLGHNQAVW
jgi:hypothetical protein